MNAFLYFLIHSLLILRQESVQTREFMKHITGTGLKEKEKETPTKEEGEGKCSNKDKQANKHAVIKTL